MAAANGGGFAVEYAKSGRASCRNTKCKGAIVRPPDKITTTFPYSLPPVLADTSLLRAPQAKDELRVARMVRSPFFDGFQPQWFHLDCFFFKNAWGAKSPPELQGVTDLRPDDQKLVADGFSKMLASQGATAAGGSKAKGKGKKGGKSPAALPADRSMELLAADGSALLRVEHAKSSRAGCRYCEAKIDKDVLRLGIMMEPDENSESSFRGMRTWWYHRKCFGSVLEQKIHTSIPLPTLTPQHFEGHRSITAEEIKDMSAMFDDARKKAGIAGAKGQGKKNKRDNVADDGQKMEKPKKKSKNDGNGAAAAAASTFQNTALQAKLTAQASELWKIKDELALSGLTTGDLKDMLSANNQPARGGESTLRDLVADGMQFGALSCCAECGNAAWILKSDGYHCQGDVSAYAPCLVVTHDPPRKPWKISKNYRSRAGTAFFTSWKFVQRSRLFGEAPRVRTDGQPAADEIAEAGVHASAASAAAPQDVKKAAEAAGKPLTRLKIAYAGKVGMSKLKKIVTKLGGENTTKLNSTV